MRMQAMGSIYAVAWRLLQKRIAASRRTEGYRGGKWRARGGSEKRSALGKCAMPPSRRLELRDYGLVYASTSVPSVQGFMLATSLEGSNQVARKGGYCV